MTGAAATEIATAGMLTINGGSVHTLSQTLNNAGTIVHNAAGSLQISSAVLNNLPGAVYEFRAGTLVLVGSGSAVNNTGTFRKRTSSIADVNVQFNNDAGGLVDVKEGTLRFVQSTSATDSRFQVATGARVEFRTTLGGGSTNHEFAGTITGTGGGTIALTSGAFFQVPAAATFDFPGGLFQWEGGEISGPGTLTNANVINIVGAAAHTINDRVDNTGTIVHSSTGNLTLVSATLNNLAGAVYDLIDGFVPALENSFQVITNQGTDAVTGTFAGVPTGTQITYAGDTGNDVVIQNVTAQPNTSPSVVAACWPGTGDLNNSGTFCKSGGTDETMVAMDFNNAPSGIVNVQTGRLKLSGSGGDAQDGRFDVAAGAVFELAALLTMSGQFTGSGAGRIELTGRVQGDKDHPAVLDFPEGFFHWIGGGGGSFGPVINEGFVTLSGDQAKIFRGQIINRGSFIHTGDGNFELAADSVFYNEGLYELRSDADIRTQFSLTLGQMLFMNSGILGKSAGLGVSEISGFDLDRSLLFNNSGTVDVHVGTVSFGAAHTSIAQLQGNTLTGGSWIVAASATLDMASGANITASSANVTLDGADSSFPNIANLAVNGGSFRLLGGRDFATVGDLTNGVLRLDTTVDTLHPLLGSLVGIAFDPVSANLFLYPDFDPSVYQFTPGGDEVLPGIARPGANSNNFDLDFATQTVNIGGTEVPAGTLLAVNGDDSPTTLYALDKDSGAVLASIVLDQASLTGLAYHATRGTLLAVSPRTNEIHEIDPANGLTLRTFSINPSGAPLFTLTNGFSDIEVDQNSGNLLIVSGNQNIVRELTVGGELVRDMDLNLWGIMRMSGIALDDATGEAWISSTLGTVHRVRGFSFRTVGDITIGPGSTLTVNGNFTENSPQTLNIEIGDRPDTGQFGRVDITGTARLEGAFRLTLVGGLVEGDGYKVMSFQDRMGTSFTRFDGVAEFFDVILTDVAMFIFVGPPPQIDLVVRDVQGPTEVIAGDTVVLQWTVLNLGTSPAMGPWHDRVELSRVVVDSEEGETVVETIEVADVRVGEGLTLASLESATFSAEVHVPGAEIGEYRWSVRTNSRADVFEDEGRANNLHVDADPVLLDFTQRQVNGAPFNGQFAEPGQPHWFKLDVAPGQDVMVSLDLIDEPGVSELYLGRGFVPTRFQYTRRHRELGAPDVSATIVAGDQTETWFVLALPISLTTMPADFSVSADFVPLELKGVSPTAVGNRGTVTLKIQGAQLRDNLLYRIAGPGGTVRDGSEVKRVDSSTVVVTFDMDGMATGVYDITVSDESTVLASLPSGLRVESADLGEIEVTLTVPSVVRAGRIVPIRISYANTGNIDVSLPFLTVTASEGDLRVRRDGLSSQSDLTIVPPQFVDGLTSMPPGSRGELTLYYTPPLQDVMARIDVYAQTIDDPGFGDTAIDWQAIGESLRPPDVSDEAWNAFIAANRARYGETYRDLFEFIAGEYADLSRKGYRDIMFFEGYMNFSLPPPTGVEETLRGRTEIFEEPLTLASDLPSTPRAFFTHQMSVQPNGSGPGNQSVHAVIVGGGGLPGAGSDARAMADFFTKGVNLPHGSTVTTAIEEFDDQGFRVGDRVSSADALAAFEQAAARTDDNDILFVFNASHGRCDIKSNKVVQIERIDDNTEHITGRRVEVPENPRFAFSLIDDTDVLSPEQINSALTKARGRVVFVADTCHSGAITDGIQADVKVASSEFTTVSDQKTFGKELLKQLKRDPSNLDVIRASNAAASTWVQDQLSTMRKSHPNGADLAQQGLQLWRMNSFDRPGTLDQQRMTFAWDRIDTLRVTKPDGSKDFTAITESDAEIQRLRSIGQEYRELDVPVLDRGGNEEFVLPIKNVKAGASDQVEDDNKKDKERGSEEVDVRRSFDPNQKIGPSGSGPRGYIGPEVAMPFTITFENDPELATLPAQVVQITDILDEELDLSTFELSEIAVGPLVVQVPAGLYAYSTNVDLLPQGIDLFVQIDAELNFLTRTVTWTFTSLDPVTRQLPEDPLVGFLLINDETGRGEGHVSYTVRPLPGLSTGVEITNTASIVFDVNEPIVTNQTLNTIDAASPSSSVDPLPTTTATASFTVSWSGSDDAGGSEIAVFDVFVSTDGGAFEPFLSGTTATSANFTGEDDHSYAFYTVAVDNVGHRESPPAVPDAETTISVPPTVVDVYVSSTAWSPSFKLAADPIHGIGHPIPKGAAQVNSLMWGNIDQIHVRFSEDVGASLQDSAFALSGTNGGTYPLSVFGDYDISSNTATLRLDSPLGRDRLQLRVRDLLFDSRGNALDGEWTDRLAADRSGHGAPGGDFLLGFVVLPGDINQSGGVSVDDIRPLRDGLGSRLGDANYSFFTDLNGSGQIAVNDVFPLRANLGQSAPASSPASPAQTILQMPAAAIESVDRVMDALGRDGQQNFHGDSESVLDSQTWDEILSISLRRPRGKKLPMAFAS